MILFKVFADLFRRRDIGGGMKAVWIIFVILLALPRRVHLPDRGGPKYGRPQDGAAAGAAKAQQEEYIQVGRRTCSPADQIAQAKHLLDSGAITQAEFDTMKQKALA